ncbi:MAG: DNA-binding protein WhiA [Clostridia bacterium]|nr:DNA-binding protein WhiA [Clostridia bacterium]
MNFSLRLKAELIEGAPRGGCCKAAYLRGLFLDAAQTSKKGIVLRITSVDARRECARLFREMYRREALMDGSTVLFASDALYEELTQAPPIFACPHCAAHFLRGALISCGSVTEPTKGYHMEYRLSDAENLPLLADTLLMLDENWKGKSRATARGVSLYFKNSTVIEEILTLLGANNALFALINAKIERDIRNAENRATNCVMKNIGKTVDAASEVCAAVETIRIAAKFDSLTTELQETATLRVANPNASLSELAKMHNPPITKSGLNHRLQKIIQFAANLKTTSENR